MLFYRRCVMMQKTQVFGYHNGFEGSAEFMKEHRGVAQLAAHLLWEQEARGSNPRTRKARNASGQTGRRRFPLAGNWSKIGVDHMFDRN